MRPHDFRFLLKRPLACAVTSLDAVLVTHSVCYFDQGIVYRFEIKYCLQERVSFEWGAATYLNHRPDLVELIHCCARVCSRWEHPKCFRGCQNGHNGMFVVGTDLWWHKLVSRDRCQYFFRPRATKSGRPQGVMYVVIADRPPPPTLLGWPPIAGLPPRHYIVTRRSHDTAGALGLYTDGASLFSRRTHEEHNILVWHSLFEPCRVVFFFSVDNKMFLCTSLWILVRIKTFYNLCVTEFVSNVPKRLTKEQVMFHFASLRTVRHCWKNGTRPSGIFHWCVCAIKLAFGNFSKSHKTILNMSFGTVLRLPNPQIWSRTRSGRFSLWSPGGVLSVCTCAVFNQSECRWFELHRKQRN